MEDLGLRGSYWSVQKMENISLFPDDRESNDVPRVSGNALLVFYDEDRFKDGEATYRGTVSCGSEGTDLHPRLRNSACCRSEEFEYRYHDEIVSVEIPRDRADLATELDKRLRHVFAVNLKLDEHPREVTAFLSPTQAPVHVYNDSYVAQTPVSRFVYEAELSIARSPGDSVTSDDPNADADMEKFLGTTKALVTIQREVICNLGPSDETNDIGLAVPA